MSQPPTPPPGPAPTEYGYYGAPQQQDTNGAAIAALVSGILGLTLFFGIASIPALICGYIARNQIRQSQGRQGGAGMAMAGIILGWIGVIISLLMIVLLLAGVVALFGFAASGELEDVVEEGTTFVAQGSLADTTEEEAQCTGIERYPDQGADHIDLGESHEPYNSSPPTSGPHAAVPAETGFYREEDGISPETLVHNMEHGQVIIWYRPNTNPILEEQVETLVSQQPVATVGAPYAAMNEPYNIVITSWTKARACVDPSQEVVDDFRRRFQGKAPEPLTPSFNG